MLSAASLGEWLARDVLKPTRGLLRRLATEGAVGKGG